MSKKFNVADVVKARKNELDASPLFQARNPEKAAAAPEDNIGHVEETKSKEISLSPTQEMVLPPVSDKQTASLKPKRVMRLRQSFDIYEDQYQELKKISDAEKGYLNGRTMSVMVRQALDYYLKRFKKSPPQE